MASAQVKSAVLLAGLFADGVTSVTEPRLHGITPSWPWKNLVRPSRKTADDSIHGPPSANGSGKLLAKSLMSVICLPHIFIAAASLFPDSNVLIHNVGLTERGRSFWTYLLRWAPQFKSSGSRAPGEIVGDLAVKGASLKVA